MMRASGNHHAANLIGVSLPDSSTRYRNSLPALKCGTYLAGTNTASPLFGLPLMASFGQPADYYATALHELCHWTGHPSRLNRLLGQRQEIEAYAYEELVAEIGAAFMCAHCGIPAVLEHASYISTWLDALRRDKRLIFVAAGAAQKAADFVTGFAVQSSAT